MALLSEPYTASQAYIIFFLSDCLMRHKPTNPSRLVNPNHKIWKLEKTALFGFLSL